MIVYFQTFFTVFVLGYIAQKKIPTSETLLEKGKHKYTGEVKFLLFLAIAVLICIAGLRYNVGTDYGSYYRQYDGYADRLGRNLATFNEPGYGLIAAFSRAVGGDGGLAVFLASAITIGLILITLLKNTDEVFYALILYMTLGCWSDSFNGVRQAMAVAFVFCGYSCIRERKFFKYLLFVFAGFLCHKSAIILLVLYFVLFRKINILNIIVSFIGIFILLQSYSAIFSFATDFFDTRYSADYGYILNSVNIFRVLVGIAPAVFFLIVTRNQEKTRIIEFHLNIIIVHAALNIVTMNSTYLARFPMYTAPFVVISILELSKLIEYKYKKLVMGLIIILYFAFWIYGISISSAENNYMFIWQK